jgi:diguanylate cyclase (GGDEF)-like protein
MADSAIEDVTGIPASSRRKWVVAAKCALATLTATVLWCAIWLIFDNAPATHEAGPHLLWHLWIPALILTLVTLLAYRENRKWWRPSRRLKEILEGCRAGECPIEELNDVGGAMAGVARAVAEVLHELRNQKRLTAEFETELSQRVAQRTSALERQMGSLRVKATRDPLTGLYNRRMLEECLPKMIHECRSSGDELSILAIDVDNFKDLNDSLGHAVGDQFLRAIAQILRSGVRECDATIRCGGDEFIVLMPGCSLEVARAQADRLALLVESLAKTIRSPQPPGLSIGTASLAHIDPAIPTESAAPALLEAADKRLYQKKGSRKRHVA